MACVTGPPFLDFLNVQQQTTFSAECFAVMIRTLWHVGTPKKCPRSAHLLPSACTGKVMLGVIYDQFEGKSEIWADLIMIEECLYQTLISHFNNKNSWFYSHSINFDFFKTLTLVWYYTFTLLINNNNVNLKFQ